MYLKELFIHKVSGHGTQFWIEGPIDVSNKKLSVIVDFCLEKEDNDLKFN